MYYIGWDIGIKNLAYCIIEQLPDKTECIKELEIINLIDEPTIKQYPNPADHSATFEFSVIEDQEVSVSILNINGQVVGTVYSGDARANETYKFEYNVTNLQSGIYYVHLNTTNGIMKEKFVIIK